MPARAWHSKSPRQFHATGWLNLTLDETRVISTRRLHTSIKRREGRGGPFAAFHASGADVVRRVPGRSGLAGDEASDAQPTRRGPGSTGSILAAGCGSGANRRATRVTGESPEVSKTDHSRRRRNCGLVQLTVAFAVTQFWLQGTSRDPSRGRSRSAREASTHDRFSEQPRWLGDQNSTALADGGMINDAKPPPRPGAQRRTSMRTVSGSPA